MKITQLIIRDIKKFLVCIFSVILFGCSLDEHANDPIEQFIYQQAIDKSITGWRTELKKPPMAVFLENATYFWELKTNIGDLTVKLMPKIAPMHVSSTIYLTKLGFYDEMTFHRIIKGFVAQGGDPYGNGTGGPGYQYAGEFSDEVKHDKPGILSMANRGANTDGSQFFITFEAAPHLDGRHSIFGIVVKGMETLKLMEEMGSYSGKPKQPIVINTASIIVEKH